jgi:hypothetical protein
LAELSTWLVATLPLTAITVPEPQALPPEAVTALSAVAQMTAVSSAVTVRLSAFTVSTYVKLI